jgi:membrane protease YdiL (CAAX protease family)
MPDPTALVLQISFLTALGVFLVASVIVAVLRRKTGWTPTLGATEGMELPRPASGPPPLPAVSPVWPYETGASQSVLRAPYALPGVATSTYRPLDFLWAGGIFIIFFALSIGNATADTTKIKLDAPTLLISMVFQAVIALVTLFFVFWRIRPIEWLGLKWRSWPRVFLIAPATVVGMWIVFWALQLVGYMEWMESLGVESTQETVKLLQTATNPVVISLMAVAAVLVAPICEEIVFRGYLFPFAKKYTGTWVAAICSGLIFAAAHGSLAALLPLFIFGVVLAMLYEKTGSIWAPIAVHFCFNGATVAIQSLARHFPQLIEQAK